MKVWRSMAAVTVLLAASGFPAGAETLFEAMAWAYQNNPTLRAQRAQLRSTDENVPQALSGWRPTVTASGSAGLSRSKIDNQEGQSLRPYSGALELNQPLYRGGRTIAGTRQAESQVEAGREFLRSTEQDVLLASVTAFMDVLRDQARVELQRSNEEVLRRQLEASRDRFEVGEITRTDVSQSEARLSRAFADRVSAEGDLQSSRATYARVNGQMPGSLQPAPPLPPLPDSLEAAIEFALSGNPDLAGSLYVEEAAGHGVRVAFGNLLPSVSLVGRAQRSEELNFEDANSRDDRLTAQVTVPLYQAGAVSSQVRQSKEVRNQRRIEIEQTRRFVVEQATQAWHDLVSARQQIVSRREQVSANEVALEGVRQEAAVGSRTTLDVLDAEQELLDSSVSLVIAQRDEYVAGYRLLAAIGRLSAEALQLPVEVYDPSRHYHAVRDRWWGWGTDQD